MKTITVGRVLGKAPSSLDIRRLYDCPIDPVQIRFYEEVPSLIYRKVRHERTAIALRRMKGKTWDGKPVLIALLCDSITLHEGQLVYASDKARRLTEKELEWLLGYPHIFLLKE